MPEGIKRLFLGAVAHPMKGITNEAHAWRLGWLLEFTLPVLAAWRLFLPPILAIVAVVLMALSPTFVVDRPLVLGLGGVIGK